MSDNLTAIEQLSDNYPTSSTHTISATSYCVLLFLSEYLSNRKFWLNANNPLDEVSDEEWDTIEGYVDRAYRELQTRMIGQILPFAVATLPTNVLLCDGTQYQRVDYPDLYAILDPAFIVDADNFIVPDMRSRVPIGVGQGISLSDYQMGDTGGVESVELTTGQLASHNHSANAHSHTDAGHTHAYVSALASVVTPGELPIPVGAAIPSPAATSVGYASISAETVTINSTGDGDPHENRQPYIAIKWGIVAR